MATYTGPRAAANFPVPSVPSLQGVAGRSWGYYNIASALQANDVVEFCWVPAGATVIGGFYQAADIDTGTETWDFDIGWAANGVDAADPDGFGNFGVQDGDAVAQFRPVAGIYYPFVNIIQDSGFKTFSANTKIIGTCVAAANMGGTGMLKVVVDWVGGGISAP